MLLDHGTDVNEAPGDDYGRTALQAAALLEPGPQKSTVVALLLKRDANIGAGPANVGGVTALQAAAISGDIMLAELLLSRGADVNEDSAEYDGRTALEGAAEHGRLDMVQLLLNAGAKGDFDFMMEVVEEGGHFAVANLLREHEEECDI
jgi:ankyrin repeat protein